METGENNKISSYISKSFSVEKTELYHLSVEISPNKLTYCLLDTNKFEYVFLKSANTNDISDIIQLIGEDELLKSNFFSSTLSYSNFPSSIIPNKFYKKENEKTILEFENEIFDVMKRDNIHQIDSKIAYSIPSELEDFISDIFPSIVEKNSTNIIIDQLINQGKTTNEKSVFAFIENKKVEIIILKNDKLCFRNSFDFESETDLLYYVLFCFEQLKLYPEKTPLVLFGDVKKEDRNFNILYDYVRNVSFGNKAEKLTYPTEFSEIKNQEYFALFSQVLCV